MEHMVWQEGLALGSSGGNTYTFEMYGLTVKKKNVQASNYRHVTATIVQTTGTIRADGSNQSQKLC